MSARRTNARAVIRACAYITLALYACGGGKQVDPRYPPQPEGCPVKLFHGSPTMQTDNLGAVSATCDESVSEADCLRTLQDEACKIGADVVWGVPEKPDMTYGKNKYTGRAAHTK